MARKIKQVVDQAKAEQVKSEFLETAFTDYLYQHFSQEVNKILKQKSEKYSFKMLTDEDRHFVGTIIRYFAKSKEFYDSKIIANEKSLNKGLLIMGHNGIGKSLIMMAMSKCNATLGYAANNFKEVSCHAVVGKYDSQGYGGIEEYLVNQWSFDDIGTEPKGRHYGKEIEVMQIVLEERSRLFNRTGLKTHMTSNKTPDEFHERYGERVADRLKEMFNIVVYNRKDSFRR